MAKPIIKLKLLNEVEAVIIGLKPGEDEVISDMFAFEAPNYFFNPKYKAKLWDGLIRFVSKTGKTYVNLLPRIIPVLKELGYDISIIDNRDSVSIRIPEITNEYLSEFGWTLAEHQVDLVNHVTRVNGCMVRAGTGAGKTLCCWVLHDLYYKYCGFETLIIVPTSDLIHQTVAELKNFSEDVGLWGDGKKDTDHPVVVSTWQTLQKQAGFVGKYKHIIMDECHGGKNFSAQINVILNDFAKNCYVKTGMTGTFPQDKCGMMTLECAMGQVGFEISARELIDIDWLATMDLHMMLLYEDFKPEYKNFLIEWDENIRQNIEKDPEFKVLPTPTYKEFKKMLFPEYPNESAYLRKNEKRNQFISEFVIAKRNSMEVGNSVVLVNTKIHGKLLESMIPNSKFIWGDNATKVRKEMFDLFSSDDNVVMITTYGLAAVGLNIKRIFNIYMIDSGRSFIRVIQTIGRGLRKDVDKFKVNVYDIHSNLYYNNIHNRDRLKFYNDEKHPITTKRKIIYR